MFGRLDRAYREELYPPDDIEGHRGFRQSEEGVLVDLLFGEPASLQFTQILNQGSDGEVCRIALPGFPKLRPKW